MDQNSSPRSQTVGVWRFLLLFLGLPILLGGLFLLSPWARPLSGEVRVRWAVLQAKDCLARGESVECYVERLSSLMKSGDRQLAREVCARLGDPACF